MKSKKVERTIRECSDFGGNGEVFVCLGKTVVKFTECNFHYERLDLDDPVTLDSFDVVIVGLGACVTKEQALRSLKEVIVKLEAR